MIFSRSLHYFLRLALAVMFALIALRPLAASPALAQGSQTVTMESVQVDIWPEYDQPAVLVIYHVSLASSVSLPAALTMRIPASAGKPYAVAMQDVNGLYDLKYELNAAGDWIEVIFTTPVPDFRIEYYDPELNIEGARRDYTFSWPADYSTSSLAISIQQPVAASNISFLPSIGSGAQAADGMTYFTKLVGSVAAGTQVDLRMGYDNPQNMLTNPQQFQNAQPSQPVDASTPGRVNLLKGFSMSTAQVALLIAGILLIAGGLAWYWHTGAGQGFPFRRMLAGGEKNTARRRHARSTGPLAVEAEGAPENIFCHHCGKRASAGDAFCRACGTKLRW